MPEVIIIGAGLTGLSCAWRLKRLGLECLILEASPRAGGVIQSERVDGYLIEHGPNTLLPSSENFTLLDESGLSREILEGDRRAPRFICLGGRLRKAPFGVMSIGGLIRAAGEPLVRSRSGDDESVHDFFTRRLGREAEEHLVSPFVTGIYAGNTQTLSMAATFPNQARMEREHGSLIVGMLRSRKPKGARRGHTCSFAEGMETLPKRLAESANIAYGAQGSQVGRGLEVRWNSETMQPKAVVIATTASGAAKVLRESFPDIAAIVNKVEYAPMVIATSSLPDTAFPQPLRGFGFLVPRSEGFHLLGTLFNSALFPGRAPDGRQLLTSFVGGAHEPEALTWTDERIWETVPSELQRILKVSVPPDPLRIIRHERAIPQYKIGHERFESSLKKTLKSTPGLFMAGNYLAGVSLAACIDNGERTAREVAHYVRSKA